MSDFIYTNTEGTTCDSCSQSLVVEPAEEKIYVKPDPSTGKRYTSFDALLHDLCTPDQIAEIHALMATQTVGTELTSMRIRSGISQKMMAAALGVSQPRISAIETAPNSKISMKTIQRYVEVTRCPFKAVLEDGGILTYTLPGLTRPRTRRKKPAAACV